MGHFSAALEDAAAAYEGAAEGEFVREFDVASHGEAGGEAADGEVGEVFEDARQIGGGGFTNSVGVGGEDDFFDVCVGGVAVGVFDGFRNPSEEVADVELVGPDAFERVECPAENVVAAVEFAGAFDGLDVLGFFDDADYFEVSFGVGADAAGVGFGNVAADVAVGDAFADGGDCVGEPVDGVGFLGEQMEGDPLGAFGSNSGQFAEFVNEVLDGTFVHLLVLQ